MWFIKPHLLQNDQCPKYADLHIFKMKENIGVIGYSRVAEKSNTCGIADYYVRASILNTRINEDLYKEPEKLYNFKIDKGRFPCRIKNNYEKFKLNNDNNTTTNIEFFIKDNNFSKEITPHKSKDTSMPDKIKMNGIEISFSKTSTNEDFETHVATKNIIPLQHINYLDNISCFVDFSPPPPPRDNNPKLCVQNMNSGEVYHIDKIEIDNKFKCKGYKGSTPFIEIKNNLFITIVHKRCNNSLYTHNLYYDYILVIFDIKTIIINNNEILLPNKCIKEIPLNINFGKDFIFITGLIIQCAIFNLDNNLIELDILISYGISDSKSGISTINIKTI